MPNQDTTDTRRLFALSTWGLGRDDILTLDPALARCGSGLFLFAALASGLPAFAAAVYTGEAVWLCLFVVLFSPVWLLGRAAQRLLRPGPWKARAAYRRYRRAILRWRGREGLPGKERLEAHWLALDCWAFEQELCALLLARGVPALLTRRGADGGVDIMACLEGKTAYIQCKRYRGRVGVPVIRELYGVMARENVERGVVAAPGGFTEGARAFAGEAGVGLWDAAFLAKMARRAG